MSTSLLEIESIARITEALMENGIESGDIPDGLRFALRLRNDGIEANEAARITGMAFAFLVTGRQEQPHD